MGYRLQIPGKTFCCGEYAALVGGPAVLISTRPGFEIDFEKSQSITENPFHPQSPAGFYFNKYSEFFKNYVIKFQDHYNGRGGFGASTAQFLGLAYFKTSQESGSEDIFKKIWKDYQSTNRSLNPMAAESQLPSGYDLWAQMLGEVTLVKRTSMTADAVFENQRTQWMFKDLDFMIVPTGFKIATHTHLNQLNTESLRQLSSVSQNVVDSWLAADSASFLARMQSWAQSLQILGLVHSNTQMLLSSLGKHKEILFAKGCGALGADILFIVFKNGTQDAVKTILSEMNLNEAYDRSDVWTHELRMQK